PWSRNSTNPCTAPPGPIASATVIVYGSCSWYNGSLSRPSLAVDSSKERSTRSRSNRPEPGSRSALEITLEPAGRPPNALIALPRTCSLRPPSYPFEVSMTEFGRPSSAQAVATASGTFASPEVPRTTREPFPKCLSFDGTIGHPPHDLLRQKRENQQSAEDIDTHSSEERPILHSTELTAEVQQTNLDSSKIRVRHERKRNEQIVPDRKKFNQTNRQYSVG